jgi:hypothetical protein
MRILAIKLCCDEPTFIRLWAQAITLGIAETTPTRSKTLKICVVVRGEMMMSDLLMIEQVRGIMRIPRRFNGMGPRSGRSRAAYGSLSLLRHWQRKARGV